MEVFNQLVERSLPYLESYQEDLLKHDKRELEMYPGRKFIHFTGSMGTYVIMLYELEDYPADGELVPYLFGTADRWHILKQLGVMVDCIINHSNRTELVLYYDGQSLKKITLEKALDIVKSYTKKIKSEWLKRRNP